MCEYCETKGMIGIDEPILDALIIASGLTADDIKKLNLQKKIAKPVKPTYKPNPNLGEGAASKENLAYRQELMNLDKELDKKTGSIIKSKDTPLERIKAIDTTIDDTIQKAQNLVEKRIKKAYMDGGNQLYIKLKKYGAKKPKIPANPERLEFIILQQKYNIEDKYLKLRGRLRQVIMVKAVMDGYNAG